MKTQHMAVKPIIKLGEPNLRKISTEVPLAQIQSSEVKEMIQDLKDTFLAYKRSNGIFRGVGLAANQLGINKRIFLICVLNQRKSKFIEEFPLTIFINPVLISHSDEMVDGFEGCISFKHYRAAIRRYREVTVEAYNEEGEKVTHTLTGFHARVFQHEYDHLNGVIYIDKADIRTLVTEKTYKAHWKKAVFADISNLRTNKY